MLDASFLEKLGNVLGPKGLVTDSSDIAPWLTDWRKLYVGRAAALLAPANAGEAQAVMRLLAEYGVPMVPQGGNSSMVGGATPDDSGKAVILSTRRMNSIRLLDADASIVVAEAGVIPALSLDARGAGVRHHWGAGFNQCGWDTGSAVRHYAQAGAGD